MVRNRAVLSGLNLCVADGPPEDSGRSGFAGQKSDRNWADSDGLIKSTRTVRVGRADSPLLLVSQWSQAGRSYSQGAFSSSTKPEPYPSKPISFISCPWKGSSPRIRLLELFPDGPSASPDTLRHPPSCPLGISKNLNSNSWFSCQWRLLGFYS